MKKIKAQTTVIVFGKHHLSALDIIRSLGPAGYRVSLAFIGNGDRIFHIASKSRYVSEAIRIPLAAKDKIINDILDFCRKIEGDKLLFPIDDYAVFLMDKYMEELSKVCQIPISSKQKKGDLIRLMDKHEQSLLARKAGLNTPQDWVFDLSQDIVIPDDIVFPCFCKPLTSVSGPKNEQRKCTDSASLLEHLNYLKKISCDRSVLVQQFLNITDEYTIMGVSTEAGVHISGIINKIQTTKHATGLTFLGELVDLEDINGFAEIKDKIISFLRSTDYIGLFDLEFAFADKTLYFIELNIRAGGFSYCLKKAGINAPAAFVNSLLCHELDEKVYGQAHYGKIYLKERNAIEDYIRGFITLKELCSYYKKADDFLITGKEDPLPTVYFYIYWIGIIIKDKIKKRRSKK